MPVGTPLEQTARVLRDMGQYLQTVPEVTDYQAYAGTASPINFNGLVRQYYLRRKPGAGRYPGQPGRQASSRPQQPRHRRLGPRGADPDRQAARCGRDGGGGASRPAGAFADRGGDLRSRLRRADAGCEAGACAVRRDPGYRRHRRHRGRQCAAVRPARAAEQGGAVGRGAEGRGRDDAHGPVRRVRDADPQRRGEVRDPGPADASARAPERGRRAAEAHRAQPRRGPGAAVRAGSGGRERPREDHLPQGPGAGGLRDGRHGRQARQPAVRHVRHPLAHRRNESARGRRVCWSTSSGSPKTAIGTTPSSGTANGR